MVPTENWLLKQAMFRREIETATAAICDDTPRCVVCGSVLRIDNASGLCQSCRNVGLSARRCRCGCGLYLSRRNKSGFSLECGRRLLGIAKPSGST